MFPIRSRTFCCGRPVRLVKRKASWLCSATNDRKTKAETMLLELESSQLVLIDYQARLMPAMHESEEVLRNALRLIYPKA